MVRVGKKKKRYQTQMLTFLLQTHLELRCTFQDNGLNTHIFYPIKFNYLGTKV